VNSTRFLARLRRRRAAPDRLHCLEGGRPPAGREFATPDDVKRIVRPVLRHRLILRTEAEIEGLTADACIDELVAGVWVPR
jgi:MoxR-like ATPase